MGQAITAFQNKSIDNFYIVQWMSKLHKKQDVAYKGKIKDCQSTRKLNVNNT